MARAHGSLDREQILRAAMAAVDRDGAEALSMRRLAVELGAGTMSLYRHVRDRDEVFDLLAERLALEVVVPAARPEAWREQIHLLLGSLRDVAHAHPGAFPLLALRPLATEAGLRRTKEAVTLLAGAGRSSAATATAARTLVSFTNGYVLAELVGRTELPGESADADATFHAGIDLVLDGLAGLS